MDSVLGSEDRKTQQHQAEALFQAALDSLAEGSAAGAVELFQGAIRADPTHIEAKHGLIRALEEVGQVDEAQRITEMLIAADPDDVLAVTRLSMLYQHKGMIAEAEAAAARAKVLGWKMELRTGVAPTTEL